MKSLVRIILLSWGCVLAVGFSAHAADEASDRLSKLTAVSRRNFLRGVGAVAISPVLPKPVIDLALPEAAADTVAQRILSGTLLDQLESRLRFSPTSYLLDHRVSQFANGFFTAIDNSHKLTDLALRRDIFARVVDMNAFETDEKFLNDMEKDVAVAEMVESFFFIAEDVAQDPKFSLKFVETETIKLVRLLEGSAGAIMREDQHLREQGAPETLVREYRQLFLAEVKQRHPIIYRHYLHNWNIGRGSVYRVAQVMGFAEEDVETYRSLRALLNFSNDPGEYLTGEGRLYFEEQKKQAQQIHDQLQNQDLSLVRSRILYQIQMRAKTCEQLLVTRDSDQKKGLGRFEGEMDDVVL